MTSWRRAGALALLGAASLLACRRGSPPPVGSPAPAFALPDASGALVRPSDFRGRWLVLYFYPKDFTPGCTLEARGFQRDAKQYERRNAVIVGVSVQPPASHRAFRAKEGLGFELLSDARGRVSRAYGSYLDLEVAGFSARRTFLIDPDGVIRAEFLSVDPAGHGAQVLAALDRLRKPAP